MNSPEAAEYNKLMSASSPDEMGPPWTQWNIAKGVGQKMEVEYGGQKLQKVNPKMYFTIPDEAAIPAMKNIEKLKSALAPVSQQYQTDLSFKFPTGYYAFINTLDRLVVHYTNPEAKSDINRVVTQWINNIGSQAVPRAYTHGFDTKDPSIKGGASFGDMVAKRIVDYVKQSAASGYNAEQIANAVIQYRGEFFKEVDLSQVQQAQGQ